MAHNQELCNTIIDSSFDDTDLSPAFLAEVRKVVDLMFWDTERLSSSGVETLEKLAARVGLISLNSKLKV
jgi:hypothetical protein